MMLRYHCQIKGRVQGVSYRISAKHKAEQLGLSGWVRNLPDGQVELIAEGDDLALQALLDWAHQGPTLAVVDDIALSTGPASGEFAGFSIR